MISLRQVYNAYLKEFPGIFKEHLPEDSDLVLEDDFVEHKEHDLEVLRRIILHLQTALKFGWKRPLKSLNLYLWSSKPSFGKSRLLDFMLDNLVGYRLPDDQYYTDYQNLRYQILISDEAHKFLKTKDYSHLKHIFEGRYTEFNRKQKQKVFKNDNPLIILADNISFDELMTKEHKNYYSKEVMDTRVLDLELRSRATLHFFLDRCLLVKDKDPKQLEIKFNKTTK